MNRWSYRRREIYTGSHLTGIQMTQMAPMDAGRPQPVASSLKRIAGSPADIRKVTLMQAAKDVVRCLDKVAQHYKSAVLDYATWYREAHKEEATYSEFITRLTCHLIVHTSFLSPNLVWDVVQFD